MRELLAEHDPDVRLAIVAANLAAEKVYDEHFKRLAQYVVKELSDAFN